MFPDLRQDYSFEIETDQPGLVNLKGLVAVTNVEFLSSLKEGQVPFRVTARGATGELTAELSLTLTAHPQVVVARSSLQRGHLITASDVTMDVVPADRMKGEYLTDINDAIGKEVRSSLSANRPIMRDRLGAPILIRRGEGVDLQVVGGGVTAEEFLRLVERQIPRKERG